MTLLVCRKRDLLGSIVDSAAGTHYQITFNFIDLCKPLVYNNSIEDSNDNRKVPPQRIEEVF